MYFSKTEIHKDIINDMPNVSASIFSFGVELLKLGMLSMKKNNEIIAIAKNKFMRLFIF